MGYVPTGYTIAAIVLSILLVIGGVVFFLEHNRFAECQDLQATCSARNVIASEAKQPSLAWDAPSPRPPTATLKGRTTRANSPSPGGRELEGGRKENVEVKNKRAAKNHFPFLCVILAFNL